MTLSTKKRGYRTITIGDELYRWRFAANSDFGQLTVVKVSGTKSSLVVSLPEFRGIWVDFSKESKDTPFLRMTPALVAIIIKEALKLGWTPTRAGLPFRCSRLANSTFHEPNGPSTHHKTSTA